MDHLATRKVNELSQAINMPTHLPQGFVGFFVGLGFALVLEDAMVFEDAMVLEDATEVDLDVLTAVVGWKLHMWVKTHNAQLF